MSIEELGDGICLRAGRIAAAEAEMLPWIAEFDRREGWAGPEDVPLLHHPAQPWGDPTALADGCGQLVSAETLPPDHVAPRLDLDYVVTVLVAQAS